MRVECEQRRARLQPSQDSVISPSSVSLGSGLENPVGGRGRKPSPGGGTRRGDLWLWRCSGSVPFGFWVLEVARGSCAGLAGSRQAEEGSEGGGCGVHWPRRRVRTRSASGQGRRAWIEETGCRGAEACRVQDTEKARGEVGVGGRDLGAPKSRHRPGEHLDGHPSDPF